MRVSLPLFGVADLKEKRITFIGEKGIGKTSMIRNFLRGDKLNKNQAPTKEVHVFTREEKQIDGGFYSLTFYDTVGGIRF